MQELKGIDDTKILTKEDTSTTSSTQTDQTNKTQTYINKEQDDGTVPYYTICMYIWLTGVILLSVVTFCNEQAFITLHKKNNLLLQMKKIVQIF